MSLVAHQFQLSSFLFVYVSFVRHLVFCYGVSMRTTLERLSDLCLSISLSSFWLVWVLSTLGLQQAFLCRTRVGSFVFFFVSVVVVVVVCSYGGGPTLSYMFCAFIFTSNNHICLCPLNPEPFLLIFGTLLCDKYTFVKCCCLLKYHMSCLFLPGDLSSLAFVYIVV